jgi:hypothetical protein
MRQVKIGNFPKFKFLYDFGYSFRKNQEILHEKHIFCFLSGEIVLNVIFVNRGFFGSPEIRERVKKK